MSGGWTVPGAAGTRVVNMRVEACDVAICRPGRWGNPFSHLPSSSATWRVSGRSEAVEAFEAWLRFAGDERAVWMRANIGQLVGQTLGCVCEPAPCHGRVLVQAVVEHLAGRWDVWT